MTGDIDQRMGSHSRERPHGKRSHCMNRGILTQQKEPGLVSKRNLLRLTATSNLCRRLAKEAQEGVGQMGLIEIARLVHHVGDRPALL